ncbi:MAG: AmmeMemoRadiSam system protein A [Bacillota bacterium]
MGRIISSYIFPHPPIIVPEVGKGEEKGALDTVNAAQKASRDIKNEKPSTIILTTPHAPRFQDYIYISDSEVLKGDLGNFGSKGVSLSFRNNVELVNKIKEYAAEEGIGSGGIEPGLGRKYGISNELDHGALVPLYYINKEYSDFKLVHIAMSTFTLEEYYKFGMCIKKAVRDMDEDVVFVASGDLSHTLTDESPYGYNKHGKEFDDLLLESIRQNNIERLLDLDENFCESAGECGLRPFVMMFGALDGHEIEPEIYSYEGPFGIGYMVARLKVEKEDPSQRVLERRYGKTGKSKDPYVALAKEALEAYVREGRVVEIPTDMPAEMMNHRAGTFVSLKKKGELRGCIGTIAPTRESIASEIVYNAISSGTEDPRFYPVKPYELDGLEYSVDVLMEPEPISSIEELDVEKYGVIVRSGRRSGLLLPNLEGIDTPVEQVSIALQKAGINPGDDYTMERFEVIRHK